MDCHFWCSTSCCQMICFNPPAVSLPFFYCKVTVCSTAPLPQQSSRICHNQFFTSFASLAVTGFTCKAYIFKRGRSFPRRVLVYALSPWKINVSLSLHYNKSLRTKCNRSVETVDYSCPPPHPLTIIFNIIIRLTLLQTNQLLTSRHT